LSGREAVFGKIRRSLGVSGAEPSRNATVDNRLKTRPRGVVPARGQLPAAERLALFTRLAERSAASVARVADASQVPAAIAEFLRQRNLPAAVRMGEDKRLAAMPWNETQIEMKHGAADGNDAVSVGHAFAAVAESGTLVLTSGADNPTTLNFLPETAIVVLAAADIAGDYETVWDRLQPAGGEGLLPRTVNWITGPSRSADIEQTLLLGAHGPRSLHIVVVGG
jgi:L-lactate dehydrogenase complex protein LldG